MTRDEWLAARRTGIGATDATRICGLAPPSWGSAFQVWLEKTSTVAEQDDTPWLKRGRVLEAAVRDEWCRRSGLMCERAGLVMARDPDVPHFCCSPDDYLLDGAARRIGVYEGKLAAPWKGGDWGEDGDIGDETTAPMHYVAQVQWQLGVTGVRFGMLTVAVARLDLSAPCDSDDPLAALMSAMDIRSFRMERDEPLIRAMRERCAEWWQRHVVERAPPPLDGSEAADAWLLDRLGKPTRDEVVELGADVEALVAEYEAAKAEEKEAHATASAARQNLTAALGEHRKGVAGEWEMARSVVAGRVTLDSKALEREEPDVYQRFARVGRSHSRLTVKKVKK